jgi:hypothetical protein
LSPAFAYQGFSDALVQEYVNVDWDEVSGNKQRLDGLARFGELVRQ